MTPDLLDDLLDRSAPATRSADAAALEAMTTDAAREAVPRRHRRRFAITAGALAFVLASGAGIAAATDGFRWAPWAQHPVGAVSFTMQNGFDCELRFSEYRAGTDPVFLGEVNRTLADWYGSTDVVAEAQARLPAKREHWAALQNPEDAAELQRQLAELSPQERAEAIAHNAWSAEWIAWDLVVSDLETEALTDAGFTVPDARFVGSERSAQIQCFDLDGELYVPGAGS